MTVFLAKTLGIALLCISLAAPSWAQDDAGAPLQLPSVDDTQTEDDIDIRAPRSVLSRPGARDLGIEVGIISGQAPVVGTLSSAEGLGGQIWSGTSATTAQILLNQIPIGAPSRAMSALLRRLLLGASAPPNDPRGGDPIIELRIERAFDAGFIDSVPEMIEQATQLSGDPEIEQFRAEAILLRGGAREACSNQTSLRFESEVPFWMKLRAYCFWHDDLIPAARLTADLLYDVGDEDELFQVLLERLSGNEAANVEAELASQLSPMHLVMMRDAGLAPPRDLVETQSLSLARVLALEFREIDGAHDLALAMGERAASAGAISPAELLALYRDTSSFDPAQRTEQLSTAARSNTAEARAIFAEAVLVDTIPGTQAESLGAALGPVSDTALGPIYAAALGQAARSLRPDEGLAWSAFNGGLVALAAGQISAGYDWFDILGASETGSGRQIQSLRVALIMAAPSERFAFWPTYALLWLEQADLGKLPHTRLTAQLMLYGAMGYTIPEDVSMRLRFHEEELTGYVPAAAVIANLRDASANGRIGETVATALVAIGPGGPQATHPATLAEVLLALRNIGLEQDARALATEALLVMALEDVE